MSPCLLLDPLGRLCADIFRWIRCTCRLSVLAAMWSFPAIFFLLRPDAIKENTSLSRLVSRTSPNAASVIRCGEPEAFSFTATSNGWDGRTFAPRATDRIVARKSSSEVPFSTNPETPASTRSVTYAGEVPYFSRLRVSFRSRRVFPMCVKRLLLL